MGRGTKTKKIVLNESGFFLTRQKGCLVVKNIRTKKNVKKYPILERRLGEIQLASGNLVSTGVLVTACFNRMPVIVKTALGSPVGILISIDDMSHVETRCYQYEVIKHLKALNIAKEILLAKIKGSNEVLKKHGLRRIDFSVMEKVNEIYLWLLSEEELDKYIDYGVFPLDALDKLTRKYRGIEGRVANQYFRQIFSLFPERFRPKRRKGFKAYDGINNTFSLAYRILFNKVMVALIQAKLEPYLGFYHTTKFGAESLVYDFMEIYRYLVDDFLISYCTKLDTKDFELKTDAVGRKKGKRVFLNREKNGEFLEKLEQYFQSYVSIRRVRVGKRQRLENLIGEEALQLARFLRCEKKSWVPRIVAL